MYGDNVILKLSHMVKTKLKPTNDPASPGSQESL